MVTEITQEEYDNTIDEITERAVELHTENQDEYESLAEIIREEIEETENPPLNVETVLLSNQDPDDPMYTAEWSVNIDASNASWSDAVTEAAYICLFSDLLDAAEQKLDES